MTKWWRRDRRIVVDPEQGQDAVKAMREAEEWWPEVRRVNEVLSRQGRANNFRRRFEAEFKRSQARES